MRCGLSKVIMCKWLLIAGIAIALVVTMALRATDGEEAPTPLRSLNQPTSPTPQWGPLIKRGREEAEGTALGPWPFAAIKDGVALPTGFRSDVRQILGGAEQLGLRFSEARFVRSASGSGIWTVPAKGVTCMFRVPDLAAACNTTGQTYRGGLTLQTYKHRNGHPTRFAAMGIVPDGIDKVPVKIGSDWKMIPVVRNTFSVEARHSIGVPPRLTKSDNP